MTLQLERSAIETYFIAQWAGATPIILDGHGGDPTVNSVRLTIQSGAVLQGSIGRIANRINHLGMVTATIYTAGGEGSAAWRGYAETISGIFFEKTLDNAGALITASTDTFIRFSPPELSGNRHPYIAASFADAPFHLTNVIAPFVRTSYQ